MNGGYVEPLARPAVAAELRRLATAFEDTTLASGVEGGVLPVSEVVGLLRGRADVLSSSSFGSGSSGSGSSGSGSSGGSR